MPGIYSGTITRNKNVISNIENTFGNNVANIYSTITKDSIIFKSEQSNNFRNNFMFIMAKTDLWGELVNIVKIHLQAIDLITDYMFCLMSVFFIMQQPEIIKTSSAVIESKCISHHYIPEKVKAEIEKLCIEIMLKITTDIFENADLSDFVKQWYTSGEKSQLIDIVQTKITTSNDFFILGLTNNNIALILDAKYANDIYNGQQFGTMSYNTLTISACSNAVSTTGPLKDACSYPIKNIYPCTFCEGALEYYNGTHCQYCSVLICQVSETLIPCCGTEDTQCIQTELPELKCGNGIHDFGEECDESATDSILHACCHQCLLKPGFYSTPTCTTVCGDAITAGTELCDDPTSNACDPFTCRRPLTTSQDYV